MPSKCYLINVREPIRGQGRAPREELLNPMSSVMRGDRWFTETLTGSYGLWFRIELETGAPFDPPILLQWMSSCLRPSKFTQTLVCSSICLAGGLALEPQNCTMKPDRFPESLTQRSFSKSMSQHLLWQLRRRQCHQQRVQCNWLSELWHSSWEVRKHHGIWFKLAEREPRLCSAAH